MTADSLQRVLFAVGSYHLSPVAPPGRDVGEISGMADEVEVAALATPGSNPTR